MTNQGLNCYKFGTKNNWRRWQWNRIAEKLMHKPKEESVVAYLCGPDDKDREIAKSKGFRNTNIIAIDGSEENIKPIKTQGNLAIVGNLQDILLNWGNTQQIDILVADFCSGLTFEISWKFLVSIILGEALSSGAILSINLLRGRDAFFNDIRQTLGEKHRGKLFYLWYRINALLVQGLIFKGIPPDQVYYEMPKYRPEDILPQNLELAIFAFDAICNPSYWEYKSTAGNMYMDSVVLRTMPIIHGGYRGSVKSKLASKISALKAWRTMRKFNT